MTPDCQLYLITPPAIDDPVAFARQLDDLLAAAGGTGAAIACLQLRLKPTDDDTILRVGGMLQPICRSHGCDFLVNDRPDLAAQLGADGVHIGQSDMAYNEARQLLGPDRIIGVTCHNSRHLAMEAGEAGADYVAFGAFFPTQTKSVAHHADLETLATWTQMTTVPCVAIGGITPSNCAPLVAAGADFLAVSGAVWAATDGPLAAIERFADVLSR